MLVFFKVRLGMGGGQNVGSRGWDNQTKLIKVSKRKMEYKLKGRSLWMESGSEMEEFIYLKSEFMDEMLL